MLIHIVFHPHGNWTVIAFLAMIVIILQCYIVVKISLCRKIERFTVSIDEKINLQAILAATELNIDKVLSPQMQ